MADIDSPSDYVTYPEANELIAGHFLVDDTYQMKRPGGMNNWLITFTLDGEGYFKTGDDYITCSKGDIILLKPMVPHQYGTSKEKTWEFVWVHFSPELFETNFLSDKPIVNLNLDKEYIKKRIQQSFEKLIQDYRERNRYWYELCQTCLKEILLLIAQRQEQSLDPRIEEILHLLSKKMKESFSINELAKMVGLSPSRLSHLFKENVGNSVLDTLKQMRLNQATLLLEHTALTASEVALEVGYQNYNHFAIQFRNRYGISPRHYKKLKLQNHLYKNNG